jgi:hypothetical protein
LELHCRNPIREEVRELIVSLALDPTLLPCEHFGARGNEIATSALLTIQSRCPSMLVDSLNAAPANTKPRTAVILNKGAGALRASDPAGTKAQIEELFASAGHETIVSLCDGPEIGRSIAGHIEAHDVGNIVVGGGDGTASTSAAQLVGSEIALGVLPLVFRSHQRIPKSA